MKDTKPNDSVFRGRALIAHGKHQVLLKRSGARDYVDIKDGPLVSVLAVRSTAARYAGPNAAAVITTGMGDDGANGMLGDEASWSGDNCPG